MRVILVDMDGTVCDFDGRALDMLSQKYGVKPPPVEDRAYPLRDSFLDDEETRLRMVEDMKSPGFFREMAPIEGAVEALLEMQAEAELEVFLCTAPLSKSPICAAEKIEWVINHLGKDWVDRIVLTRDKSLVQGDMLIDDAPEVKASPAGSLKIPGLRPTWEHVYYTQPYNRPAKGGDGRRRRIVDWKDWRDVVMTSRPKHTMSAGSGRGGGGGGGGGSSGGGGGGGSELATVAAIGGGVAILTAAVLASGVLGWTLSIVKQ